MKNRLLNKIIGIMIIVLLLVSSIFFVYSILLFKGLETFYRIIGGVIILYISLFLAYSINKCFRKGRIKRFYTLSIISFVLALCFAVGGYLIYNVYSKLDDFSKDAITYTSKLITFNSKYENISSIKKSKIGIVNDEKDYELYIIPMEIIKDNKLEDTNEIVEYNSIIDLVKALYDEEVDSAFINSNYGELFLTFDEYSDIKEKAIEIASKSKKVEKSIASSEIVNTSSLKKLTEPFTILLLGVDSEADGLNKNAAFNGDTIMLVTFDPKTLNATMFSIPRDTYVKIACGNRQMQKINTSAYGGTSCVIKTIKNMTGIDVDYYAKINFKGVVSLVDSIGGIEVDVPYKFCEQNSSRQWGENTVYVESGIQNLNGEQALALARNRKTNDDCAPEWNKEGPRNDFIRGQNQQLVVEGILNQVKNIRSANTFMDVLDVISKNIDTNLSTDQILSFYDVVKNIISAKSIDIVNIQKTFLRGYDMYVYEPSAGGTRYAFFNWKGSLDDIVDAMETNLGKKDRKTIKEFSFDSNKEYVKEIVGDKTYKETKIKYVPSFVGYSYTQAKSWGEENSITVNFFDYETKEAITNITDTIFIEQSVKEKTLLVKAGDTINLYYKVKKVETAEPLDLTEQTEDGGPETEE